MYWPLLSLSLSASFYTELSLSLLSALCVCVCLLAVRFYIWPAFGACKSGKRGKKGEGICNVCDLPCGNVMWAPQRLAGNKWKVESGNVERGEVKEEEEE